MSEQSTDLEAPDTWDWSTAEPRPAIDNPTATVAVRFSGSDFELLAAAAGELGIGVTEFVRRAALERAGAAT